MSVLLKRYTTRLQSAFQPDSSGKPAIAKGVRTAIALCTPILIGHLTGHLSLSMVVSLGSLTVGLADVGGAYRTKFLAMLWATVGCAVAMLLGTLVGGTLWLSLVLTFLWVFVMGFIGVYGHTASVVSFVVSILFVISTPLSGGLALALQRSALVVLGSLWTMVLSLLVWPLRPYKPVQNAVAESYRAIATFMASTVAAAMHTSDPNQIWNFETGQAQDSVGQSLETARTTWTAVRVGRSGSSDRGDKLLVLIQEATQISRYLIALTEVIATQPNATALAPILPQINQVVEQMTATMRVLAEAIARSGAAVDVTALTQALGAMNRSLKTWRETPLTQQTEFEARVHGSNVARIIQAIADRIYVAADMVDSFQHNSSRRLRASSLSSSFPSPLPLLPPAEVSPLSRSSLIATFRDNWTLRSLGFCHALRLGIAATIGSLVAILLHLPRGYWVPMTIIIILKPDFGGTIQRTIQRVGGTILGGAIGFALASVIHDEWILLMVLALLAAVFVALVPVNYGIAIIFLTPMVVVMINVINLGNWQVAGVRVMDTIIGGALALASYWLFPSWERQRLPEQLIALLQANRTYFQTVLAVYLGQRLDRQALRSARQKTDLANANASASTQRLLSEPRHMRGAVEPVMALIINARAFFNAVTTLSNHLNTFSGHHELPGLDQLTQQIEAVLTDLITVLQMGHCPSPMPALDVTLSQVREHLEELHATRLSERSRTAVSAQTPTREAVVDYTLVSVELDRICREVMGMHEAIVRLHDCNAVPVAAQQGDRVAY